jgi:hypothetical protein
MLRTQRPGQQLGKIENTDACEGFAHEISAGEFMKRKLSVESTNAKITQITQLPPNCHDSSCRKTSRQKRKKQKSP